MDYTQNYNLNLPEHGYRNWDTPNNENFEIIDSALNGLETSKVNLNLGNSTAISNCITEIPQDIKLELVDGTLTLKAGSKVYVPNGFEEDGTTPKFDVVTIENDIDVTTFGTDGDVFQIMFAGYSGVYGRNSNQVFSGSTAPTSTTYMVWYDTTNNLIKHTSDGGSTWSAGGDAFPLSISSTVSSSYTSIKQVFNGFGYIGSVIFALPGVKGLIPNGRNEDGSLKSISFEIDSVKTMTNLGSSDFRNCVIYSDLSIGHPMGVTYDSVNNMTYESEHDTSGFCIFGGATFSSGRVTSFTPKTAFHTLDYNDLSPVQCVVETYVNGTSWYRIWSADSTGNRWVEQGGNTQKSSVVSASNITFLKPFLNIDYTIIALPNASNSTGSAFNDTDDKTTTGCIIRNSNTCLGHHWYACGYGA